MWVYMFLQLVIAYLTSMCTEKCKGANILAMFPYPFYSHTNTVKPILRELATRGHNITLVSPYPENNKLDNWVDIVISDSKLQDVGMSGYISLKSAFLLFTEPKFIEFLHDTTFKFELVLTETFFMHEPFVAFGYKYNCPIINFHPAEPFFLASPYTGNQEPFSYIPNVNMATVPQLTLLERVQNTFMQATTRLLGDYLYLPIQESWMRANMNESTGFNDLPPLKTMLVNTSLTLVDYHFSLGTLRPFHSNIVSVGGLSLLNASPLSKGLQSFMDDSTNGVVFFSFGSRFNTLLLPESIKQAITGALLGLKQNVIIKWPVEIQNQLESVKVGKWWPQPSILAHPNCVAFVSHGGLHAIYETLNKGVPIVGIPIFGDQIKNIRMAEADGYGIYLDWHNISDKIIFDAINEVIQDPSYKINAVKKSMIVMDRPISPLQESVFWIEYVLRHKGAYHLRPSSVDLPMYQYLLLDVVAVILIVCIFKFGIIVVILKLYCRVPNKIRH